MDEQSQTHEGFVIITREPHYIADTIKVLAGAIQHRKSKRVFAAITTEYWVSRTYFNANNKFEFGMDEILLHEKDYTNLAEAELWYRRHRPISQSEGRLYAKVANYMTKHGFFDLDNVNKVREYIRSQNMGSKIRGATPRMVYDLPTVIPKYPVGQLLLLAVCKIDDVYYGAIYDKDTGNAYVEVIHWNPYSNSITNNESRKIHDDTEYSLILNFFNKNLIFDQANIANGMRNWFFPRGQRNDQPSGHTTEFLSQPVIESFKTIDKRRIKKPI